MRPPSSPPATATDKTRNQPSRRDFMRTGVAGVFVGHPLLTLIGGIGGTIAATSSCTEAPEDPKPTTTTNNDSIQISIYHPTLLEELKGLETRTGDDELNSSAEFGIDAGGAGVTADGAFSNLSVESQRIVHITYSYKAFKEALKKGTINPEAFDNFITILSDPHRHAELINKESNKPIATGLPKNALIFSLEPIMPQIAGGGFQVKGLLKVLQNTSEGHNTETGNKPDELLGYQPVPGGSWVVSLSNFTNFLRQEYEEAKKAAASSPNPVPKNTNWKQAVTSPREAAPPAAATGR